MHSHAHTHTNVIFTNVVFVHAEDTPGNEPVLPVERRGGAMSKSTQATSKTRGRGM